jgi:hypothetical protein
MNSSTSMYERAKSFNQTKAGSSNRDSYVRPESESAACLLRHGMTSHTNIQKCYSKYLFTPPHIIKCRYLTAHVSKNINTLIAVYVLQYVVRNVALYHTTGTTAV